MNTEKFESLESSVTNSMRERLGLMQEHAEHFAHKQMEDMIAKEEAYELSEDEERLLKSYRAFKIRSKPGDVFSWKSPLQDKEILIPDTPSLLVDPREVSK